LQFIGKLMRSIDPTPIANGLAALDRRATESAAAFHRIESARDQLRTAGDRALGDILAIWPHAEISLLRQWIRQHPQEVGKGNERAHSRKLFRYLAELDQSGDDTS
ncbi:MAG: ribosome biogenesis factor YjgA, partial [Pseudomonadota bacterium]|nr:ribosome biogenesis factor YjgA [Pseudomonadota bacterium]